MKEKRTGGQFRTSIGGQALIEGILMRGPKKQAIVVRSPEGLVREVEELHLIKDKYPILGWPIIRGAVTFVDSMVRGVKALMFSADYFPELEESEPSKLDRWLEAHVSEQKLQSVMVWVSVILSLGMSIALFLLLPTFIAGLFHAQTPALHNLIEGVVKILVLLAAAPSALRHERFVRGHHRLDPRQQHRLPLYQLAESLGAHRREAAAADPGRRRYL